MSQAPDHLDRIPASKADIANVLAALAELQVKPTEKEWLSSAELGALLSVSKATLCRWRAEGLPHVQRGEKFLYHRGRVNTWLEAQEKG